MTEIVIYIVFTALLWGGYPLILRLAGNTGHVGALILATTAIIPIWFTTLAKPETVNPASLPKLIPSGLMMGAGLLFFTMVVSSSRIEASVSVPIISASMLLVTTIGGIIFFSEAVTIQKTAGIILILAGIVLLRPQ